MLLSGCSGSDTKPEPEAVELKAAEGRIIDLPETELINEAMRLFQGGYYTVARDNFESLRTNYPLSPYSELAAIKSADCQFETNDFGPAAVAYEDFFKNHPVSESAPYALFMAARSNQLSNRGLGRDVAPLEKALELYTRLISNYPDSPYAENSAMFRREVQQALSDYEKVIAEYYRRRNALPAAETREKIRSDRWDAALAQADQAATSGPASIGIVAASVPLPVLPEPDPQAARGNRAVFQSQPDLVQNVECLSQDGRRVFLYLNRPVEDSAWQRRYQRVSPENGLITLKIPGASAQPRKFDCFGKEDLTIDSDGGIHLESELPARILELSKPDRLLIVLP